VRRTIFVLTPEQNIPVSAPQVPGKATEQRPHPGGIIGPYASLR